MVYSDDKIGAPICLAQNLDQGVQCIYLSFIPDFREEKQKYEIREKVLKNGGFPLNQKLVWQPQEEQILKKKGFQKKKVFYFLLDRSGSMSNFSKSG